MTEDRESSCPGNPRTVKNEYGARGEADYGVKTPLADISANTKLRL